MRDRLKRTGRVIGRVLLVLLAIAVLPSVFGMARAVIACRMWEEPPANELGSATRDTAVTEVTDEIEGYARAEDQTYLTFPEWYIVYSTDEYAAFIAGNPPSQFPYFKAIGQYWGSYNEICAVTHARYPLNGSYQFTLGFIGVSFTAENMIKGLYEVTVGRVTEWVSAGGDTEEDDYAAQVAQQYGAFLHHTPWYDFNFRQALEGLWNDVPLWGPHMTRKLERRFALTTEYGIKMLYGGFISRASRVAYGGPDETKIYAVGEGVTEDMLSEDFEVLQPIDDERDVLFITRYEAFSQNIPPLLEKGLTFVDIAGNDEILVTAFGPDQDAYDFEHGEYLFKLPVLTEPGTARLAFQVRVAELGAFIEELAEDQDYRFEHIYDY
jgi:hypothetical protein